MANCLNNDDVIENSNKISKTIITFEELDAKQKLETKELEIKIKTLKKSIVKGDANLKRHVLDKIIMLENDLATKHKDELQNLTNYSKKPKDNSLISDVSGTVDGNKKSKAQKRRLKKEQKELELNEKFAEMNSEKTDGEIERQAILKAIGPSADIYDIQPGNLIYYLQVPLPRGIPHSQPPNIIVS